jgi:hypothetical protein
LRHKGGAIKLLAYFKVLGIERVRGLTSGIAKSRNPKYLYGWRSWSHQLVTRSWGSHLVLFHTSVIP